MSHGPEDAQCEYNINEEANEANQTDNEIRKNDARKISNLKWVTVRYEQGVKRK